MKKNYDRYLSVTVHQVFHTYQLMFRWICVSVTRTVSVLATRRTPVRLINPIFFITDLQLRCLKKCK